MRRKECRSASFRCLRSLGGRTRTRARRRERRGRELREKTLSTDSCHASPFHCNSSCAVGKRLRKVQNFSSPKLPHDFRPRNSAVCETPRTSPLGRAQKTLRRASSSLNLAVWPPSNAALTSHVSLSLVGSKVLANCLGQVHELSLANLPLLTGISPVVC